MSKHTWLAELNHTKENDWKIQVDVLDDYIAYQDEHLFMQSKSQHIWDGHVLQTKVTELGIELVSKDKWKILSVPYQACSRGQEPDIHEIDKKLRMDILKQEQPG